MRNRTIRDTLGVRHVRDVIEEHQLKWYRHICRRGDERRAMWLEARPRVQRPVGHPRITYNGYRDRFRRERGLTLGEMKRKAKGGPRLLHA